MTRDVSQITEEIHQGVNAMNAASSRTFTVAVVDPNSTDYDSLLTPQRALS